MERISRLISRVLFDLSSEQLLEESVEDLYRLLREASPEEVWEIASRGTYLFELMDSRWRSRYNALVKAVKLMKLEDAVLSFLEELTVERVLEAFLKKAVRRSDEKALRSLSFIASSPTLMRWLKDNLDAFKRRLAEDLKSKAE